MTVSHGFELLRENDIPEINGKVGLYRHVGTGAQLMSVINADENKVFGISFRTPPADSTGVAHILEHSVLCGSRKYPLKEPFVELLKGSLKTFLNAFTYPDKTCYPVASQNAQDFYNLVDVYLDAVFHPRLTPFVLQQEGWHYELEDPDAPLTIKGVVFNEMKGNYSSPERILSEYSQQFLFPDNTYGFESGGDPHRIPDLTFSEFEAFHRRFYHPANARIYFYGDDDPERRLRILDEYLKDFGPSEVDSTVSLQPRFDRPRRITRPFAAPKPEADEEDATDDGSAGSPGPKGMVTVSWLLPETVEAETTMSFYILEYILLGMPGSPLRKALIDSGLGEDLTGVGLEAELRQMYFSTGLKGIDPANADRVEALIVETLTKLAKEGIDPLTVEAAMNTVEFRLRENNTGSYPRGLALMLRALTTWLYDGDPFALPAFEKLLDAVKSRLAENKSYFEGMIDCFFLNNPHRLTLIMEPDPEMEEREAGLERERLEKVKASMTPDELRQIIENTRELKRLQSTPDSPEALATIPTLRIEDLDRKNKTIPIAVSEQGRAGILHHDLDTNGIVYLDLGLNLRALKQKHLPYVPLFGRALLEMGTEKEDYVALSQRISRQTGGIHPQEFTSTRASGNGSGPGQAVTWSVLRTKAMAGRAHELLDILRDVLLTVRLDDRDRFRQIVLEEKARQEQGMAPSGHHIVDSRLRAHFSEADWVSEQMEGVSYFFFLRALAEAVDRNWPEVLSVLEEIRHVLVHRNTLIANVTLNGDGWAEFQPMLRDFLGSFPTAGPLTEAVWTPEPVPVFEGLSMPTQVNYVGKGADLYGLGYRYHGSALAITRYIRTSWLWDQVRVQGGAYGAFCSLNRLSGILTFVSYRDPNLISTLDAFDRTVQFLADADIGPDELRKAIIGAIGDIDSYMLPSAKGYASMARYLTGDSEEERQRLRDEVLGTTVRHFRAFGEVLRDVRDKGIVKVLGSQSTLEKAVDDGLGGMNILKVL